MSKAGKTALALTILAASVVVATVALSASGSSVSFYTIAAPTFVPADSSTHNNAGSSACAAGFVPSQPQSENKGDLNAMKGSFLAPVHLTDGSIVKSFSLYVNDNDGDDGTYVYLVRKLLEPGLSPQFNGYKVMAQTQSKGAVLNTMRKFTAKSIASAKVDDSRFSYYVEMVNCATVEPFAVQIGYSK